MGRSNKQKTRDGNKGSLPQVPKNLKIEPDGIDEEFSRELADVDDKEAQARASAANKRQRK
ncbi:YfhD family protein [Metabacillus fastidiosus]|uniref:YfhD family protein n=1 Tax=Metabacillus fastidiosus TaxID=1458 RepID=A0ABU6P2D1_9BACI|nr:YfhD family protein [Metabacillus fastidiosus]MED4403515.1 YfhD family protein [Metabacillus fastidiosus]MED4454547.1 YfhD family protein [Metabacillus fastidiosus]MED4461033.1 YfhD family protein [Metabacillus fastidiosus]MED4533142.1 YfhD family protein [Metabacillus fastidiosus]